LEAVKSNDALPDDLIRATTEYMKAASAVYKSEEKRREALTPLLRKILGINIQMVMNGDKTTPDGIAEVLKGVLLFLILLEEKKNVLMAPEGAMIYDKDRKAMVEIPDAKGPNGKKKVDVKLGISNGVKTEILAGLNEKQQVILQ